LLAIWSVILALVPLKDLGPERPAAMRYFHRAGGRLFKIA
jgi:hypothetical protein